MHQDRLSIRDFAQIADADLTFWKLTPDTPAVARIFSQNLYDLFSMSERSFSSPRKAD